jgi:chromatin remodeling complex protein RSC6
MQTRSGKTYNTATVTPSISLKTNKPKVETKVETNVDNRLNRLYKYLEPRQISNELAKFLGKPVGSKMLRTDVSRLINRYIRTNNLQDSVNGRRINPDKKLAKLLKLGENDELTYFNLQRYMKHHYLKN